MARNQEPDRPVTETEFERMPDRIGRQFDRVRRLLARELDGDEPGDD